MKFYLMNNDREILYNYLTVILIITRKVITTSKSIGTQARGIKRTQIEITYLLSFKIVISKKNYNKLPHPLQKSQSVCNKN